MLMEKKFPYVYAIKESVHKGIKWPVVILPYFASILGKILLYFLGGGGSRAAALIRDNEWGYLLVRPFVRPLALRPRYLAHRPSWLGLPG